MTAAALVLAACAGEVPVRSIGAPTSTSVAAAGEGSITSSLATPEPATTTPAPAPPDPPTTTPAPPEPVTAPPTLPAPGPPAVALAEGDDTSVESVVDGDTIVVAGGTRVRLIGIDTPETKDPRKPVQCFGREASAFTSSLLQAGTPVRLVYDVERLDRYGRTLAYVYRLADGLFVNAALVADGYASVATFPPNVAHVDDFTALAAAARDANRGLWSACADEPEPAPAASPPAVAPPSAGGACDPSYPGVCIPPAPPDLDCGDITDRRFQVLPPDPHRFDGNSDGVGCES